MQRPMKRQDVCNTCCIILSMQLSGTYGVELEDARPRRVSDLLTEGFDGFSRSQKAIARYIIDHLEEVGYLSAEELGRKGSTSSSTVVRFAQSLGFAGYPELQKAARDEYRLGATARPVIHDDQLGFSIEEDVLTRSLKTDALSLEETISKNTLERFNRASHLLGRRQAGAGGGDARGVCGGAARVVRVRTPRYPVSRGHGQHRVQRGPPQPIDKGRSAARHRLSQSPFGHHLVRREGRGAGGHRSS